MVLDGAQGAGAIPLDMARDRLRRLRRRRPEVAVRGRRHRNALRRSGVPGADPAGRARVPRLRGHEPGRGLPLHTDARRYDTASVSREGVAFTVAAIELLESYGLDAVHKQATQLAETSPRRSPPAADGGTPRRHHARRLGGPDPEATSDRLTEPGSSSATCRARRTCALRSARGTTSRTSGSCSRPSPVRVGLVRRVCVYAGPIQGAIPPTRTQPARSPR